MGVQGLWSLLESTGKPIPVEKLKNKVLSIDVSIWLYQIIKGVPDGEYGTVTNRHLIVMFHRICKLLFYGIKPVFVFDGGVPELKRLTIARRQAQKALAKKASEKIQQKIVKNMLEQAALKTVMDSGNTQTEDEVISQTVKMLHKEPENDLFQLPNLSKDFEIKTPEKKQSNFNLSKEKTENIVLLAVKNQEKDFLYTNSAKDKDKNSPAKLNTFSSLQIGELMNDFKDDQKRKTDTKKQQKSKHEMTLNELEMFLNNKSNTSEPIGEFSQKIASDHNTVYYYESDINKKPSSSSSSSMNNEVSNKIQTSDLKKNVTTESKNTSQKVSIPDVIGSPNLIDDIDEDIFKAFAGDESLEEDKLAWLIFNENKKASKRRSSEFESPNLRCSKTDDKGSDVLTSSEEDINTKNNKDPSRKSFENINIADDKSNEVRLDVFNEANDLSCVSSNDDDNSYRNIPSTSKDTFESYSSYKSEEAQKRTKSHSDGSYSDSPLLLSESSDGSLSENSLDFSSDDSVPGYVIQKKNIFVIEDDEDPLPPLKLDKKSMKFYAEVDALFADKRVWAMKDTLVMRKYDLELLKDKSDRLGSTITQKITSQIKMLLKLFGIPFVIAPMEAEAQCVFLEKIGRTEGTVTDDSDVWLFGANVVYRNLFDSKKYVKQFKSIDIKQKLELSRNSFIQLAFLLGSDYTNGIEGIGPVSAIEILSFFEPKTKNMNIEDKLLKIKEVANSSSDVFSHIPFIKKLKSSKISSDFPNKAVLNAYLNPSVGESDDKFNWGIPQVDNIIQFARTNFNWDVQKTQSTLEPVLKKMKAETAQKSLDSYVKSLPKLSNTNTGMSKRVNLAVKRMRNDNSSIETNTQKSENPNKISLSNISSDITDKKRRKTYK
ncbi:Hypothetical protein CINCED_3A003134 [Cinara cedri]|uniref:Uncharacterized protein n=1 Tax=Cinara cedri TaxID=506608 RepID=A0A5E4NGZ0_9HEMI|nr:Hypothetical protein CINCED_3A003134 [Cinara cedri]